MRPPRLQRFLGPPAFTAGLACTLACCVLYFFANTFPPEIFSTLDSRMVDYMFQLRGAEDSSGSVVIVDIDEKSLQEYGQWPWPRNLVAGLTEKIIAAQPAALGFDLMFAEPDRSSPSAFLEQYQLTTDGNPDSTSDAFTELFPSLPNYDEQLGRAFANNRVVQGYRFLFKEDFLKDTTQVPRTTQTLNRIPAVTIFDEIQLIAAYRPILNIPELRAGGTEGFVNLFHDTDGTVRKAPLFLLLDNTPYPSLVMEMLQTAHPERSTTLLLKSGKKDKYFPVQGISFGDTLHKTDGFGQLHINFRGPSNTFLYLSASDVMKTSELPFLYGKYVLVGSTASGTIDLVSTPFSSRMPGVEVHANILDNLIKSDVLIWEEELEQLLTYALILIGGVTISSSLVYLHPLFGLSQSLIIFISLAFGNYYWLFSEQKLIGFSCILAALILVFIVVVLCNYFFEGKKRLFIKRAFSHYVSPVVVGELMKDPDKLHLKANAREVTVLFCDIRNFTALAEDTTPDELSRFLNDYFSLLTDIILEHNGMVDKYIGDAIMAVWGTPLKDTDHAVNAVQAALKMEAAISRHQDSLQLAGQPVRIGIGINSGTVSAGNFGCSRRFDYTVLGDNVNLASRIEELTKYYPLSILISRSTRALLHAATPCRYIDTVQVKGRVRPVELFEPLMGDKIKRLEEKEYAQYLKALDLYRSGDFEQAATLFQQLFTTHNDLLYQLYSRRCSHLLEDPPRPHWCGIYTHS